MCILKAPYFLNSLNTKLAPWLEWLFPAILVKLKCIKTPSFKVVFLLARIKLDYHIETYADIAEKNETLWEEAGWPAVSMIMIDSFLCLKWLKSFSIYLFYHYYFQKWQCWCVIKTGHNNFTISNPYSIYDFQRNQYANRKALSYFPLLTARGGHLRQNFVDLAMFLQAQWTLLSRVTINPNWLFPKIWHLKLC